MTERCGSCKAFRHAALPTHVPFDGIDTELTLRKMTGRGFGHDQNWCGVVRMIGDMALDGIVSLGEAEKLYSP